MKCLAASLAARPCVADAISCQGIRGSVFLSNISVEETNQITFIAYILGLELRHRRPKK